LGHLARRRREAKSPGKLGWGKSFPEKKRRGQYRKPRGSSKKLLTFDPRSQKREEGEKAGPVLRKRAQKKGY